MKRTDRNAYMVKSYTKFYKDYKTKKQWLKLGYVVKDNCFGKLLYTNGMCQDMKIYYSPSEVMKVGK